MAPGISISYPQPVYAAAGKLGLKMSWVYLMPLSWKLQCKAAAQVGSQHTSRAVSLGWHVLEGIARRKFSWMSEFNRSGSHFSGLSLPPVCPSLSLNLPLDEIYSVGDMFSPKEKVWFKYTSPCKSQCLHFYGLHGAYIQPQVWNKFEHLRTGCLVYQIYLVEVPLTDWREGGGCAHAFFWGKPEH